ncbi:J domain-containing protein 1 [Colletotrichum musicola]|uniref:J domain-containing protein 1 n=1 Tax=Colletotrichum musicola TaxID=2175873 RepID=A0A8H6J0N7_9PEZI|nr:J domain-containing protein 1 [Colletotrichum musicola]
MALLAKWTGALHSLLKAHRRYIHSDRQSSRPCDPLQVDDPASWPRNPCPSPHDILGAEPGLPYSKKRFYRLVKLYHPDLLAVNRHRNPELSRAAVTERYRLVIEANKLLSDPGKKLLYEKYGVGWVSSQQQYRHPPRSPRTPADNAGYEDRTYTSPHGGPSGRQSPIFASNAAVAIVIVAMTMAGAIMQLERARQAQWDLKRRDVVLQEAITRDLQDMADQLEGKPRDLRILEFLARRELRNWSAQKAVFWDLDLDENICRH